MHLIPVLSVLISIANAYPLGSSLRILQVVEIARSDDYTPMALLQSPFPTFLPDIKENSALRHHSSPTDPSSIRPQDFATSFVTTLLGGGLALYFT